MDWWDWKQTRHTKHMKTEELVFLKIRSRAWQRKLVRIGIYYGPVLIKVRLRSFEYRLHSIPRERNNHGARFTMDNLTAIIIEYVTKK